MVELPQSILDAIQKASRVQTPPSHSDKRSLEELEELLFEVSPDCSYDDWYKAFAAVHHETGGSSAGLALVDRWSSGSRADLYPGFQEIERKWRSFKSDGGITGGTLAKLARDHGANLSEIAKRRANANGHAGQQKEQSREEQQKEAPGAEQPKKKSRIRLVPFDEIRLSTQRRDLIKGLIPRSGLTIVWGPPKCGKSFWLFDSLMHVVLGWVYRGRRVHQGRLSTAHSKARRALRPVLPPFATAISPKKSKCRSIWCR
jgi:hypothetical protein